MSRASSLARAFGADGTLNTSDVSGLGALAALNTVGTSQIDDSAITSAKIAAGAIPASDDASALTTGTLPIARIADGAVTAAKLASGAAVSNIGYTPANISGQTYTGTHAFDTALNASSNGSATSSGPITRIGWWSYKSFSTNFENNVSNRALRIIFPYNSLWDDGEIWVTSDYSNAMRAGIIHYSYVVHMIGAGNYSTGVFSEYSRGTTSTGFSIDGFVYDSANSRYYLDVKHITSEANPVYVTISSHRGSDGFTDCFAQQVTY